MNSILRTTIASSLTPPVFDDPTETDAAWMLHWTVFAFMATAFVAMVGVLFLVPENSPRWLALWIGFAATAGVPFLMNRAGRTAQAGIVLTALVWVGFTAAAWTAGGVDAPAIAGQLLVICTAGTLLGRRWAMGATLLGAATIMVIALAQTGGLLPSSMAHNTPMTKGLALAAYCAMLGVEWVLVRATLERSEARTRTELAERTIAEERARSLNADLELRVVARTSELEAVVRDLEATNTRLDEAMRAKDSFLASMSHELRTPLNSIIGFSGVLSQGLAGDLGEEQGRQVGMIRAAGRRLLDLVNNVLDLSQIAEGSLGIELADFDARAVVGDAVAQLEPVALAKKLSLSSEVTASVPPIRSDRRRVEQILLHLIGNAVKFTESGGVAVHVRTSRGEVLFEVTDTGVGLAKADTVRVFEHFYQVGPLAGGKHEGSGLGLAVARELAEALGGRLTVRSVVGKGSTFTLCLPALPAEQPTD